MSGALTPEPRRGVRVRTPEELRDEAGGDEELGNEPPQDAADQQRQIEALRQQLDALTQQFKSQEKGRQPQRPLTPAASRQNTPAAM